MSINELTIKVRELKELQRMAEELQEEITALQDDIKKEMETRGTEELIIDVFKVKWTTVISNRFDTTSFKKTHNDLYQQYIKQTKTRRFSIV